MSVRPRALVSTASRHGAKLGLSPDQVSEIYFDGAAVTRSRPGL